MNLVTAFDSAVEKNRLKTAIFWGEAQYSYDRLSALGQRLAHGLQTRFRVRPGDRVGVMLRNCPEFISVIFGVLQTGAVVVPVNNFLKPEEVSYILTDAGARVLITEKATAEAQAQLSALVPALQYFEIEELGSADSGASRESLGSDRRESDLAVIIYTSGTTGRPKGAMLSHGNLLSNVESCRRVLETVDFDRFVVLLPMFHSFMLCVGILLPMTTGCSIVLIKSLHPAKNVIQEILVHGATILPAIPQFFRALAGAQLPPDLPLRLCISGAAPLPAEILKEFNQKFPIPLIEGYGLSEASPVVSLNPIRGPWKAGSIGVPIPGVEVTVQDEAGQILGDNQVGEICVRGGNVMQGYWKQPEETTKAIRDAWLLTGDVGYRDEDGYFYITDRKKDMLLVNGINVYPREIEEVIYQFPGVKEAAVIGQPDARRGEQPVAFVAANEGAIVDEKALLQFVRNKLADYKVPRQVTFLRTLPRNATGKILKTALREFVQPPAG